MNWQKELQSMVDEMRERGKNLDQDVNFANDPEEKIQMQRYSQVYAEAVCFVADEIQKMFAKAEEERS